RARLERVVADGQIGRQPLAGGEAHEAAVFQVNRAAGREIGVELAARGDNADVGVVVGLGRLRRIEAHRAPDRVPVLVAEDALLAERVLVAVLDAPGVDQRLQAWRILFCRAPPARSAANSSPRKIINQCTNTSSTTCR